MGVFALLSGCASPPVSSTPKNETVVLLHGILRTSKHMKPLAEHLKNNGYNVLNIDYPSGKFPLEKLVDLTAENINSKLPVATEKVHFVGYSMGGLLARGIINKYRPANLGRVLLLATPNGGSEFANFWKENILYRKLYGEAGQQLTINNPAINEICGKIDYEVGVISGNFSIDQSSAYLISGENDGKVSIESSKIDGMRDHIVVSASHTFFPSNKEVKRQTLEFLRNGRFKHGSR